MTNVIDSLVLEFGLDHHPFIRSEQETLAQLAKMEQAAEKTGKSVEQQQRKSNELFASFRRELIGTLGILVGGYGIKEFIEHVTKLDANTGRLARTMNMSTRELAAWQVVSQQIGGSKEAISSTLQGMTRDMNAFMLTGQGTLASVLRPLGISLFDNNKQLKTAGQLMLELADAVQRMDPARASAFLSMIPGMNQDSINLLMQGRAELERSIEAAHRMGLTTEESAAQAQAYQKEVANLDAAMTNFGRNLTVLVVPAITAVFNSLAKLFSLWNTKPGSAEDVERSTGQREKLIERFGSPKAFLKRGAMPLDGSQPTGINAWILRKLDELYGPDGADEADARGRAVAGAREAEKLRGGSSPFKTAKDVEAYIRSSASARGVDPEVAVQVAKSEGLYNYVGDRGSSFGPFQLHYGGVAGAGPGMQSPGLGDAFTRKTGLDARDERTVRQQIDFALDWAKVHGWSDWHGWRGAQFAGIGGRAGGGPRTTVHVGQIVVNTQAKDAEGVGRDIKPVLERGTFSSQFNAGLD